MVAKSLQAIFLFSLISLVFLSHSLPLSTNARWIIDSASGQRVKLACVNWSAHLEPMLAEGLHKQPLNKIVAKVANMKFNCVRLTWATFMMTRADYGQVKVAQTLDSLNLTEAKQGIATNNPSLLGMTHIQAYKAVVDELGAQGIMVLIDNHISMPKWCCSYDDGNGFFGDIDFDPQEWLQGLTLIADLFKNDTQVVAISMRNELRGPRQDQDDWYKYVSDGAKAVHETNPNVLVVVSGLSYDTDLSFLGEKPLPVNLNNKLVYEVHWYAFTSPRGTWVNHPLDQTCNEIIESFIQKAFFLTSGDNMMPLLLSEFGIDQTGGNPNDNNYITCLMVYAALLDLDWAFWTLQGSYYIREGEVGHTESYGILDAEWQDIKDPVFLQRLHFLQTMNQDPHSTFPPTSNLLYHPESGYVVNTNGSWSRWEYKGDGTPIFLSASNDRCLQAVGAGRPPILSNNCSNPQSQWQLLSISKLHVAAKDANGNFLCLEKSGDSSDILTNPCVCVDNTSSDDCLGKTKNQWFELIPINTPA